MRRPRNFPTATLEQYERVATCAFGYAPENGIIRLRHGTQKDKLADLERLRKLQPMSTPELHNFFEEMAAAALGCVQEQDSPATSVLQPVITTYSTIIDYDFAPGGTPLWRPFLHGVEAESVPGSDLVVSLVIFFESTDLHFRLTPDHCKRRGITEAQAWDQAMRYLQKKTVKRFKVINR